MSASVVLSQRLNSGRGRRPPPPVVFRFDLDKTYLQTHFESLRGLAKIPFEKPADKATVPGVVPLVRGLTAAARASSRVSRLYFLSASPPQIGDAIRGKLALDGIQYDGILFKDQLRNLMRGRFRNIREQVGFKLSSLLAAQAQDPSDAEEILFGDDWESDPLIYSLYADICAGRIGADRIRDVLKPLGVDPDLIAETVDLAAAIAPRDRVRRIFINLERRTPPSKFAPYGARLVPTFNYLQTAACLFEMGLIQAEVVREIGGALASESHLTAAALSNSLLDIERRGHVDWATVTRLERELAAADLAIPRRQSLLRRAWGEYRIWRLQRRRGEQPTTVADYDAITQDTHPAPPS